MVGEGMAHSPWQYGYELYTAITNYGQKAWPIHQGNMAINCTPRQLYAIVGEGVGHSPWQDGHKDGNRSIKPSVKSVQVFQY